jgi:integrase/recombinase XerD
MRKLKHLALDQWPAADIEAFVRAYEPGDVFDETAGPGAHQSEGTRRMIRTAYRRWLGFLKEHYPDDLLQPPADRITPDRVRAFIDHLGAEVRSTTVPLPPVLI